VGIPPDIIGKINNFIFTFQKKSCPVVCPRRNSRTGGFSYNTSKEIDSFIEGYLVGS
jgi:hypothetical protein